MIRKPQFFAYAVRFFWQDSWEDVIVPHSSCGRWSLVQKAAVTKSSLARFRV